MREDARPCPVCKEEGRPGEVHSYERRFTGWATPGTMQWPSFMMTTCPAFAPLDPASRAAAMTRLKACIRCGAYLHQQVGCKRVAPRCRVPGSDGSPCGEGHLTELHECGTTAMQALGVSLALASPASQATTPSLCTFAGDSTLVPTATGDSHVLLLSDEGSQVNLVRHDTARRIGAGPGRPWEMHLRVVGDKFRSVHTKLYDIFLKDKDGKTQAIMAAGVKSITTATQCADLRRVREVFPNIKDSTLQRPQGEVEVLVGACNAGFLPFGGVRKGNLRLESSP